MFRPAAEIVTCAPLALRLPLSAELDPMATLPKLRLAGDTTNCPAAAPAPVNGILSGELDAFDTIDKLPLTAPALAGAKVAINVTLWFAVRVRGRFNPLMENPVPVKVACERVIVNPPLLVSVS